MNYINLTPHVVCLNDGRKFPPSGTVARVQSSYTDIYDDTSVVAYGEIEGLPEEGEPNTRYIVSSIVLQAAREEYMVGSRQWIQHLVAPATGHPKAIRNADGQIVSVPCFVRA
jgi:hypothetical protein